MNSIDLNRDGIHGSFVEAGQPVARDAPETQPLFNQLLTIIKRRKWLILTVISACLVLGLVITLLMKPEYTAKSMIEIQRESSSIVKVPGQDSSTSFADQEFYATQYGLLQSRALAERVATNLGLYDNLTFFEQANVRGAADWFENGRPKAAPSTRALRIRIAGEILLGKLSVQPGRLSRLVEIAFTGPDPATAQKIVNAWSVNFIEATMERRLDATSYARNFLEKRLEQLRTRIDESERRVVNYAAREGIVNLPGGQDATGAATSERSLVGDDLANLNRELVQATADRVKAQSRLKGAALETPEALVNPTISSLRQRRAELSAEYARIMVQFSPNYPPALALKSQIERLDQSIGDEERRVGGTLRETYQAARQREANLKGQVNGLKGDVLDLRRRSIQYNIFQRDADTNRQLYDALLQRYKEIGVAGGVGATNIAVVDPAEVPLRKSKPRVLLNMLLALAAGLALGAIAAWVAEQIDQGIADPSDVESTLGLPLLGSIPKLIGEPPTNALRDRKSLLTEAYISLLTRLSFATDHGIRARPRDHEFASGRGQNDHELRAGDFDRPIATERDPD